MTLHGLADWGEPVEHVAAAGGGRRRVLSTWAPVDLFALGGGFVADRAGVTLPRAAVRRVVRGDVVVRKPDAWASLLLEDGAALLLEGENEVEAGLETSAAQTWDVETAQEAGATWRLVCLHKPRPVPRKR